MNTLEAAEELRGELTRGLVEAIRIPSLSGREGRVVEYLAETMRRLDYDEVVVDGMGNLRGRMGSGPYVIALDGHCDTVDVGDPGLWTHDPFGGAEVDGKIYGRGASDQKAGVVAAIFAGALLKRRGLPPEITLYVVASVQEEDCDGLCWQYIVREEGLRPDMVVLTEPTSLGIYHGQRGRMELEVSTSGLSCHGSAPERGVNAVYKMAPVIQALEQLNASLPPRPPLGKGSLTISQIRSTSPSLCAVADGCTIHVDRRLTLGESLESSVAEIEALPAVVAAQARVRVLEYVTPSYTGLTYPTRKYYPTWEIPRESAPVQTAIAAYRDLFRAAPTVGHWTFSTNGVATAGLFGIPSIGFGPGHEHFAHFPDECVEIEHLVRATAFYVALATACAREHAAGGAA